MLKLLDLYCGGGGAAMGYHYAGITNITGVDNNPKMTRHYPFKVIHDDAIEYLKRHGAEYDIIHASPVCLKYSQSTEVARKNGKTYPDDIKKLRSELLAISKPYIIENVRRAPLKNPILLCGSMFGLHVSRHRLFESNLFIMGVPEHTSPCPYRGKHAPMGYAPSGKIITVTGRMGNMPWVQKAMRIPWLKGDAMGKAIPPAYTYFIGRKILPQIFKATHIFTPNKRKCMVTGWSKKNLQITFSDGTHTITVRQRLRRKS